MHLSNSAKERLKNKVYRLYVTIQHLPRHKNSQFYKSCNILGKCNTHPEVVLLILIQSKKLVYILSYLSIQAFLKKHILLIKGTVSQDFFDLDFPPNSSFRSQWKCPRAILILLLFHKVIGLLKDSTVLGTPGSWSKILGLGKTLKHE